eukprot:COSAG02_NODE_29635_length_565_cov_4.643777_1_plen_66_part_10
MAHGLHVFTRVDLLHALVGIPSRPKAQGAIAGAAQPPPVCVCVCALDREAALAPLLVGQQPGMATE